MLFNSQVFLFLFFPVFVTLYYVLFRFSKRTLLLIFVSAASLVFYGYYRPEYSLVLVSSIILNFIIGSLLILSRKKILLWGGVLINLGLLGVFKYVDFAIESVNFAIGTNYSLYYIALPLGISFYTFQQISFLFSVYKGELSSLKPVEYGAFVSFFPQLIAGPIVEYNEIVPQYKKLGDSHVDWDMIAKGVFLFSVGLFKKEILADSLAFFANKGFDQTIALSFAEGWITSLCYTFQIYFDFSGYSDMAVGLGAILLIDIPANFNSPYRALSVQDFWRRWHITLGRFVLKCMYIPMGGNRSGTTQTAINLVVIFFLIGLWHGAGWLFVLWGLAHGCAMAGCHLWGKYGKRIPDPLSILLTFLFVNATWVLFRSETIFDVKKIYFAMLGINGTYEMFSVASVSETYFVPIGLILFSFFVSFYLKNSIDLYRTLKFSRKTALVTILLLFVSFFTLKDSSEFIYFNF